jgi:photosystem II stability/assembly factor-like uncharacterized protein
VWRNLGPFRGGRVSAVTGAIGEPGVFYAGYPLGGVWKTTNDGHTWFPIFDAVKEASTVGSIEVAPSDTNVIYVGMGDMITGGGINEGNGVYKSVDAGKTWTHLGLDATKQIPSIVVDPHNPDLVLLAAQGNIHAKSDMRGVFRSTDGGKTWNKTLYVDDETGMQKLARAYDVPNVIFATTVHHYVAPGIPSPNTPRPTGAGTALYKSTDEGLTWKQITGGGLPELSGRTSIAVAQNTNAQRVYLIQNSGLWRSDDGGVTWRQMDAADKRIANGQGGYNCGVYVDPQNPDIVYTISTSSYKSTDGGNTFTGFKGAPGGDDPQQAWIDPTNGQRIFFGEDQGATVTLDGGRTWSPWYNQSTEQVYHISTDNSFPYWVYASQQDAGAGRTRSRGNLGEITPLDWSPVPSWEWGTVVADPLNPNIVYGSGSGIVKISYPSEQWINVSPSADPNSDIRTTSSQPIMFSPLNPHELLAGFQYVASTTDGGVTWTRLSPDLTYPRGESPPPENQKKKPDAKPDTPPNRSAIESMSVSSAAPGLIWVGTNNGLIKLTRNHGATWQDASIENLPNRARADISGIDASHQDPATAYVAVDYHSIGEYKPHFYRTHDYGKTWTEIVNGMQTDQSNGSFARVIRSDPAKPGLLFAGTESSLYVSFDDGDNWQSLMLNLPNTSYRDITFHGNDMIVGTYGRGIWVLDDYAVLRQVTPRVAAEPVHFFKPDETIRVRRNVNADTPFPPEVPHALNPPDGVIFYYSLASAPSSAVTVDVLDASGNVIRHLSSVPAAPVKEAAEPPEPNFWIAPPYALTANAGINRGNWDLRLDAPPAFSHSFEINANPERTPASPEGPLAPPGTYTLKLAVDGRTYTQTVIVKNDPRSPATVAAVRAQYALLQKLYTGSKESWDAYNQVQTMRSAIAQARSATPAAAADAALKDFDARLESIAGSTSGGRGFSRGGPAPAPSFVRVNGVMGRELTALDNGDMAPTAATLRGYAADCAQLARALQEWHSAATTGLAALNATLARNSVPALHAAAGPIPPVPACGAGLSAQDRRRVETHSGTTVSHSKADEDEDGEDGSEPM